MTTACRFSAGCCCFKNIFSLFFHIVSFFPLLFFVVFSLLCRGSGAAFFRRQGKTGFCRVGFLLCLYCFWLILLSFFFLFLFLFLFPFLFVVSPLLCRGSGAAFFRRQGKTGFCRVSFLLCLYCFRLILLSFFLSLSLPLSLCRFPFVVPGFWSGVFPPAGEDRLLPCWFFIVFVLFPIDFVVFFSFYFVVFSLFLLGMLR